MPLHEYTCRQCEHGFEALVYNNESVECPECHASDLERLLSVPAKPRNEGQSLPMNSSAKLPPCRPGCCRM